MTSDAPAGGTADRDAAAPHWGLGDVLLAFFGGYFLAAVVQAAYAAATGLETGAELPLGGLALAQLALWTGYLGVPLVATRLRGRGPEAEIGLRMQLGDIPRGLGLGVLCQFVLVPLVSAPVLWLADKPADELEEPARELADRAPGAGAVALFLLVAIGAPIAEEVLFRGMIQRLARRRLPVAPSIVLTAVLFGTSHFQALQLPALVAFGLVLGTLAHRTGRLGLPIWTHIGFNAATVVVLYASG